MLYGIAISIIAILAAVLFLILPDKRYAANRKCRDMIYRFTPEDKNGDLDAMIDYSKKGDNRDDRL